MISHAWNFLYKVFMGKPWFYDESGTLMITPELPNWSFDQYQREALKTAQCPLIGTPLVYPLLGLTGEIGEAYEKISLTYAANEWRHPSREVRRDIANELGDVLWYAAVMADRLGLSFHSLVYGYDILISEYNHKAIVHRREHGPWDGISERLGYLSISQAKLTERVKKLFRDGNGELTGDRRRAIQDALTSVVMALFGLAVSLEIPLQVIAYLNIEKLRSRRERNTIQGEGDNR